MTFWNTGKSETALERSVLVKTAVVFPFGLILSLLLAGPAGAQALAGPPTRGDSVAVSSAQEQVSGLKSGRTALLWSLLGTTVPALAASYDVYRAESSDSEVPGIVLVGALLIGPSLGHFYAANPRRALVGIGIRSLAAAAGAAGFFYFNGMNDSAGEHSNPALGQTLGAVGVALVGASLVWDIIQAPSAARAHNDRLGGPILR